MWGGYRALPAPPILCPQAYFEDNPRDLHVLRHDKPLHPAIVKPHLRNVPDYLGTSPCLPAGAGFGGEKEWDLGPWVVQRRRGKVVPGGDIVGRWGRPWGHRHPLTRCSLPAVPPSLRGIAKPHLKKRKCLRLRHAGANRRGGSMVSAE